MKHRYLLLFFPLIALASPAFAIDNVSSPYVSKDQAELEWRGEVYNDDDENDGGWEQRLGATYGITDRFAVKTEAEFEHDADDDETDFSKAALEGKIQLNERGAWFVDTGIKAKYQFNLTGEPDKLEIKAMLSKKTGAFDHRANIELERQIGEDAESDIDAGFAWSTRYAYNDLFQPGFEVYNGFGSLSEDSDFDEQEHKIGPVAYGKLDKIKYEFGYLFGLSDSAPDGMLKAMLSYEFPVK